ncbi:polysaccharide biosynthesis protein, putative [Candidatus Vecturithrix granuli]|uniref:Polysaccharide biosynthesis protein, putative n=1 Tax=Vecturithrix granuli TaxID=1499967 RepID=A0A081BYL5_VECG1|nr:polysaccharide biosynthesis protein, putative [Candidatus Vecturithrix granuli]
MAAKQLPIDLRVLRVIADRHKWMLVILTFLSFALSAFITRSMVNQYSSSITLFVDPESVLGDIAKGVAVSTNIKDQITPLQHFVQSDDFVELHVIQELNMRLSDVFVPPLGLTFMPAVLKVADSAKGMIKQIFGLEIYTLSPEQKQYLEQREIIATIKKSIKLSESRGTLLTISYTGPNQIAGQKIVEIVANQCKEFLLRAKNNETKEASRYIERQYNEATEKLENLEQELMKMRVDLFDKTPEAKIAMLQQRQNALDSLRLHEQQLEDLQMNRKDLSVKLDERRSILLSSDPKTREKLAELARTQEYQLLAAKRTQLAALLTVYTEEWPEVKKLREEIQTLEETIASNVAEGDDLARERILLADPVYNEYFSQIKQLENQEAGIIAKIKTINDNIAIYETKIKEMPEFEKSFGTIERQINLYAKLQAELASKRETARATTQLEQSRGENRIRTVNRSFPTKPIGISPIILMAGLCLFGPGIGVGLIFLFYYLNTSVKSPEDVHVEYNLPVIAVIPKTNFKRELKRHRRLLKRAGQTISRKRFRLKPGKQAVTELEPPPLPQLLPAEDQSLQEIEHSEVELFDRIMKRIPSPHISKLDVLPIVTMLTNPESHAAEEYRRLCFNVEWGIKETLSGPCKTILVTSALPQEGKTITAINLASTLARNHQVLLVDVNFRNPEIHRAFGIPQESGLSDMLEHNITPHLFAPPGSPNLSLLPAGIALSHPADLLSSKLMHQFIDSVKSSPYFEYAIFDAPPTSQLPDASILASQVDGIVWVILELSTSKELVRLALSRITNPEILGVVLNYSEQRTFPRKYERIWKDYHRGSPSPRNSRGSRRN